MGLQKQIKKDLMAAMKAKDEKKKSALRILMGEFGRHADKEISDGDVIKIVKKLIKSEKEVLDQSSGGTTNRYIEVIEAYLPKMASEEEIKAWITANVNFSTFNNKMQAMKPIMQHFGANADGNTVKKILNEM